jgi:hypothetical protein
MSTRWTEEAVIEKMNRYGFGNVSRVDFTPINKKPGFGENVDLVVKSAFIHFEFINVYYTLWEILENNGSYKFQVDTNEYWILLKNKNPVQRTMMNVHQIVENGRHLEKLINNQAEEISQLSENLESQKNKTQKLEKDLNYLSEYIINLCVQIDRITNIYNSSYMDIEDGEEIDEELYRRKHKQV